MQDLYLILPKIRLHHLHLRNVKDSVADCQRLQPYALIFCISVYLSMHYARLEYYCQRFGLFGCGLLLTTVFVIVQDSHHVKWVKIRARSTADHHNCARFTSCHVKWVKISARSTADHHNCARFG